MSNPHKFVTVVLAFGIAGCALATITPPSVDVMDVRLIGIGTTQQQLAVTLCITSPNATELVFRRVTADLEVSGTPLAAGTSDLLVRLPPLSPTAVPFTVVTTMQNVGPLLLEVLQSGNLNYRVHGTVALQGAFGITLPYSRSGYLDPLAAGLELAKAASDITPSRCMISAAAPPRT